MSQVALPFEFFVVRNKNRVNVQACEVTVALMLFNECSRLWKICNFV